MAAVWLEWKPAATNNIKPPVVKAPRTGKATDADVPRSTKPKLLPSFSKHTSMVLEMMLLGLLGAETHRWSKAAQQQGDRNNSSHHSPE